MTPETYLIGAIVLAGILVGILNGPVPVAEFLRCPRCGAAIQVVGGGGSYVGEIVVHVVPGDLSLHCPQCGYSERSWQ